MGRLLVFLLLALAFPAYGTDADSLVKKVPDSKTKTLVPIKKGPSFSLPDKTAQKAKLKSDGLKAQRDQTKGTLLNNYRKRKDGWGNTLKSPHEEAQDFLVRKNSRDIIR